MSDTTVEFGPYTFNQVTGVVERADGQSAQLTRFECAVLAILVGKKGEAVAKHQIVHMLRQAQGSRVASQKANTIEVFIKRIRQKIDPEGSLYPIHTIRTVGYMLRGDIQLPALVA